MSAPSKSTVQEVVAVYEADQPLSGEWNASSHRADVPTGHNQLEHFGWPTLSEERADGRRCGDADDFVAIEIKAGLEQRKRVIPVLVGGAGMPRADTLPESIRALARRNAVGLRPERFRVDCQGRINARTEQQAAAERERAAHAAERARGAGGGLVLAVMPGVVARLLVAVGDEVEAGEPLLVLEAMKMQNEIPAPAAGVVQTVHVTEGKAVAAGAKLVSLAPRA